jgi:hypothetical protein
MVATAALLVLHSPPATVLVSEVEKPIQTVEEPPIVEGAVFTVTIIVL